VKPAESYLPRSDNRSDSGVPSRRSIVVLVSLLTGVFPAKRFSVFTASCVHRPGVLAHPKEIYHGWSSYNNDRDMVKGKKGIHAELPIQSRNQNRVVKNRKRMAIRSDKR